MNVIRIGEAEHAAQLPARKCGVSAGDTVIVSKVLRKASARAFRPMRACCIARSGHGESFTVRKISYGEGVERIVSRLLADDRPRSRYSVHGKVRRAKHWPLRDPRGEWLAHRRAGGDPERQGRGEGRTRNRLDTDLVSRAGKAGGERKQLSVCSPRRTNDRPSRPAACHRSRRRPRAGRRRPRRPVIAPSTSSSRPAFVRMPLGARVATGVVLVSAPGFGGDNLKPIAEVRDWPQLRTTMRSFIDWTARWTLAPRPMLGRMAISAGEIAEQHAEVRPCRNRQAASAHGGGAERAVAALVEESGAATPKPMLAADRLLDQRHRRPRH